MLFFFFSCSHHPTGHQCSNRPGTLLTWVLLLCSLTMSSCLVLTDFLLSLHGIRTVYLFMFVINSFLHPLRTLIHLWCLIFISVYQHRLFFFFFFFFPPLFFFLGFPVSYHYSYSWGPVCEVRWSLIARS
ncbi:hypothetical protein BCR41DRAFT_16643 [Lobosporangium transversale]|uniref:Uncharacterized protein n=1 Tax=Lobosporangium transversale TaxID=64571 RepID=A0A1Y2GTP9_9FUNG|nr:hypothetical protein BCR41DRAFT_16643 [Lobosporangium transversale]ORZ22861.1 hypothetical protein BCR41DRAFT_16643 [Lobosporangium transversale]|eukprot:XP_021883415.1 hypothetical protein BCR41DRAFT_16643 [Lobosporangium transversale]